MTIYFSHFVRYLILLPGYALGTVVEACIHGQTGTSHPDPIHITAHFLRATNIGEGEVRVRLVKQGKTFTNLQAELEQKARIDVLSYQPFTKYTPYW